MEKKHYSLIIAGVGGQGNVLASHIIADAALQSGYRVTVAETYGGAMRGGAVFSLIKIGENTFSPLIFEDSLDVLIGLEPLEALRLGVQYLSPSGTVIINVRPINPVDVNIGRAKYPDVSKIISSLKELCTEAVCLDAVKLAQEAGNIRTVNMVMLGALAETRLLPISVKVIRRAVLKRVPKGTEEVNLRAFELGGDAVKEHARKRRRRY